MFKATRHSRKWIFFGGLIATHALLVWAASNDYIDDMPFIKYSAYMSVMPIVIFMLKNNCSAGICIGLIIGWGVFLTVWAGLHYMFACLLDTMMNKIPFSPR